MIQDEGATQLLRQILENLKTPDRLDGHPWARGLTVEEWRAADPGRSELSPGTQLVLAMGELFRELLPVTPPQDGKRLDTRWGRFGILAANYFAPLCFGRMYPHSLREAWRRIDQAILLFVYGKTADELAAEQVQTYRLIGDEGDFAANSTISDWHRDGVQALTDLFLTHEKHLSVSAGEPSPVYPEAGRAEAKKPERRRVASRRRTILRTAGLVLLVGLLAAATALGMKGWRIYRLAGSVKVDLTKLSALNISSLDSPDLERVGPALVQTHGDIEALRTEVAPWLWLSGQLGWVPTYGGDLEHAGDLLEMASNATASASLAYQSTSVILQAMRENHTNLKGSEVAGLLLYTQPALVQSKAELSHAMDLRRRIDADQLTPDLRAALEKADGYFPAMDEALSLGLSLPGLLGASDAGPKTYLVLVQNEDELRATGGFITAVGKVVVWNGELISWDLVDSYTVDDPNKAYPPAPWQMQSFMNIPIMTFRDANWSPDYPTTVKWAEYLYAYTNAYSVDGVLAIDQHVLKSLLKVTGPLRVDELNETITADNVEQVMREQKVPPEEQLKDPHWYRKQFLNPIAETVLKRILSGSEIAWEDLIRTMVGELDQRHILLQFDDPTAAAAIAARGWDGSVSRRDGDFLMVVDTNVGYNKTNAVVDTRLAYSVDLTNLSAPTSRLQVLVHNGASGTDGQCDQRPTGVDRSSLEYWYAIDRCYYGYLRAYLPAGATLAGASPHPVTRDEMVMLDHDVPARVDTLNEDLPGLRGFGTLLVAPIGGTVETDLKFALPADVVRSQGATGDRLYSLRVQKQAGTVATPITVSIQLPAGAEITSVTPTDYAESKGRLAFELQLTTDITLQIQFHP